MAVSCLNDPAIKVLGEKYKKRSAQFFLRWGIQRNTVVTPKIWKLERLKEKLDAFDSEISAKDTVKIKALDGKYCTNQPTKLWVLMSMSSTSKNASSVSQASLIFLLLESEIL